MTPNELTEWAFAIFFIFAAIAPLVVAVAFSLGYAIATVVKWLKEARR